MTPRGEENVRTGFAPEVNSGPPTSKPGVKACLQHMN